MLHQTHEYLARTIRIVRRILLVFFIIRFFFLGAGVVDGQSMVPTLQDHQLFFVHKLGYLFHEPRLNDVVQAYHPQAPTALIIKRIVGLPGDTVTLRNVAFITLAPHTYFLVGDNTDASTDSRDFGPVSRNRIIGKVL